MATAPSSEESCASRGEVVEVCGAKGGKGGSAGEEKRRERAARKLAQASEADERNDVGFESIMSDRSIGHEPEVTMTGTRY